MHLLSVMGGSLNSRSMARRLHCSEEKKQIALNVLEICKEEKRYGELLVPMIQATARAAMLTGVFIISLHRFKTQSLIEKVQPRKERSDKITVDDFDRCVIRRTINNMLVSKKNFAYCEKCSGRNKV